MLTEKEGLVQCCERFKNPLSESVCTAHGQKVRTVSVSSQTVALSFNVGGVFAWLAGFKSVSHVTHPLQTGSAKEGRLNC